MILDTIDHSVRYEPLHPRLRLAFSFLRGMNGQEADGRHEIDGDDVFALVQRVITKPIAEVEFEAHRRYIDVQYLLEGEETILWAPISAITETVRLYDETKDVAKWRLVHPHTPLRLRPGTFAIFYPEDAHSPCVAAPEPGPVTKVVIKVRGA
jgi:biofilm protein TabA